MTLTEREFIARIRSRGSVDSSRLVLGIGDDCAVYRHSEKVADHTLDLITTDALIESVHFDLAWHPAKDLGRKSLSVNISDIAAMGGQPLFALLSVGVPASLDANLLDDFMNGFDEVLAENHMVLIGGDTVKSADFLVSVTVIGEVDESEILYRSGAAKGDSVWVSGSLGQAAAGLEICRSGIPVDGSAGLVKAHLDPQAKVALGRLLAGSGLLNSMMDVSDGVATDLAHLCAESRGGALLEAACLPISADLKRAAERLGGSVFEWALSGGEDYQLLFTAPAKYDERLLKMAGDAGEKISRIGVMTKSGGVFLNCEGQKLDISYKGFDHFGKS